VSRDWGYLQFHVGDWKISLLDFLQLGAQGSFCYKRYNRVFIVLLLWLCFWIIVVYCRLLDLTEELDGLAVEDAKCS
jgi:hypothetical protein